MADFISTLTGQEMDAALSDMAMHTSEAYAVGTRNGSVVTSGDPTYHNNAKYYAEVAASVISGTVTEAVRWDTPQALTNAQQAQARENIGAMAATTSGVNLLDNPWFTIQQRGTSAFTAQGYTADRWYKYQTYGIVTPSTSGLVINKNGDTYVELRSMYELDRFATSGNGKTFTISMMLSDGRIESKQFTMASSSLDTNVYFTFDAANDVRVNLFTNTTQFVVRFVIYSSFTIRAVKLEVGSVSTLANDTPPNYAEELAKCQHYFIRYAPTAYTALWAGTGVNSTQIATIIPTPTTMRQVNPTTSLTGTLYFSNGSALLTVTKLDGYWAAGNNIRAIWTVSGTVTNYAFYTAYTYGSSNVVIDLSADL